MRATLLLVVIALLLLISGAAQAQEPARPGEPTTHYYGAAGSRIEVAWKLDRTTVLEDGEILATLVITGATNPPQVIRPPLSQLPEFQDRFVITDGVALAPAADSRTVSFPYRLRPRNRSVDRVPTLEFRFYNAGGPLGSQYPTARARYVPITVTTAPPKLAPPPVPLGEPEHLFRIATGLTLLQRANTGPVRTAWVLLGVIIPLLAVLWYATWRQVYPGAHRLARIRRSRAARRAVDLLNRAPRSPDPPAATTAAVLGYLQARFALQPGIVTPTEVAQALRDLEVQNTVCEAVAEVLQRCDAARFAPSGESMVAPVAAAEALIAQLEDA